MKILIFGAHPDDIEVGMGGSIYNLYRKNHEVLSVINIVPNQVELRRKETKKALTLLGSKVKFLDIDPYEFKFERKIVSLYDSIIKEFKPEMIFTHWNHDSHPDHITTSNLTISAARKNSCSLYMYEQTIPGGITPYSFRAQMYIDITDSINKKIESLRVHKTQLKQNKHWWIHGVKGRATFRGYQIDTKYAEAFETVKEIYNFW